MAGTRLSAAAWLAKWKLKFADNEFQNITEKTFRDKDEDHAVSFVDWDGLDVIVAGIRAGATPFVAGEAIKAGEFKFNSATPAVFFTPITDKASPQVEPYLPESTSEVNALYRPLFDDTSLRAWLAELQADLVFAEQELTNLTNAVGSRDGLLTTVKTSIVAAINDLFGKFAFKANLVGGKVKLSELPTATSADVLAGNSASVLITPAALSGAGLPFGATVFKDKWNPTTNVLSGTGFALVEAEAAKGAEYLVLADSADFSTQTVLGTNNDTYISVANKSGIGYGHQVTGAGVPAGTRVVQVSGGASSTVVLNTNVTVASNTTLTFTPRVGNLTSFKAGQWLFHGGGNVWYLRGGTDATAPAVNVRTLPPNGAITFEADAHYAPVSSGSFTVNLAGKQVGSEVVIYLTPSASDPTGNLPASQFQKTGDYQAGKNLEYVFHVGANGFIQYIVTPLD